MNTSRFFLAGILCMSLLSPGALPQATDDHAALVKQSSIIFCGHGQPRRGHVLCWRAPVGRGPLSFALTRF